MISKVYFPRLVLPMASVLGGLVDFAIAFVIMGGMMVYYKVTPTVDALWAVPVFILLTIITALGVALWLSAINVQYRDVGYALPFLTQFWLFVTPVAYSSKVISDKWQMVYALNPMAGVVNGFRWALLGKGNAPDVLVAISTGIAIVVLVSGLVYFRNMERTFADTI
jgi:lipopolysaccharide transport system permease protein